MNNWFKEKRFGMFVHWGLYAIPAVHEQYWQRWNITREDYIKYAEQFNPRQFSPAQWLDLAQEAGMEYLCITTKHHDGFCLWDTRHTDFNVMNTPFGKDILAMLAEECQKRKFPLEFYYSVVDWHYPAYPNLGRHHEIVTDPARHNMQRYVDFVKDQMRELCTNYGPIHGIWWDMNVPLHHDPSVNQLIRELQPGVLINNRGFDEGDFSTPERDWDPEAANPHGGKQPLVEACQSVGINSWGYRRDEDYYSSRYLMKSIDDWMAKGANYLLNIGPQADGAIPPQSVQILKNIGRWMKNVRPAFDGVVDGSLNDPALKLIRNGDTYYLHSPQDLTSTTISLRTFDRVPKSVTLLNTGEALKWTFEPIVYERNQVKPYLRLREINTDSLTSPAVIKIVF